MKREMEFRLKMEVDKMRETYDQSINQSPVKGLISP